MNAKDPRATVQAVFDQAPFIALVGYRLIDAGEGWVETGLEVRPEHLQQHGYVHAGVVTTMADHTAGAAASTLIPTGSSILTAELTMRLLRPAAGESLSCRATVVKPGRKLTVVEANVHAGDRHVGLFHATMAVVDRDMATPS